jgi:hypothetical protein
MCLRVFANYAITSFGSPYTYTLQNLIISFLCKRQYILLVAIRKMNRTLKVSLEISS